MQEFKVRASASGKLAPNARKKGETLSQTTKTYAENWLKERIYGVKNEFSSKYTEKGTLMEDVAIDKAIEWLDIPFALKNEKQFEDDYFTGSPDVILEDEILDIKCSWDCFTFPLFEKELPSKDYYYQMQVYMHLTGKKKARVIYMLLNTPDNVSKYETKHNYDEIDKRWRVRTFEVKYDIEAINMLIMKVQEVRKYLKSINNQN